MGHAGGSSKIDANNSPVLDAHTIGYRDPAGEVRSEQLDDEPLFLIKS